MVNDTILGKMDKINPARPIGKVAECILVVSRTIRFRGFFHLMPGAKGLSEAQSLAEDKEV